MAGIPALEGFFPAPVLYEFGPISLPTLTETRPAERACVETAVAKRQREFLSGRAAARRVLARLGIRDHELLVEPSRAPRWPFGVVGSIAHSDQMVLTAVAPSTLIGGLGVDCEPDAPLEPELWKRICTPTELDWAKSQGTPGRWVRLLFSIKEAAYKYQHPLTGAFLGFDEVEVVLARSSRTFQLRLLGNHASSQVAPVLAAARGAWVEVAEHLVCVAWARPPGGSVPGLGEPSASS